MNAIQYLDELYARFGAPQMTNFSPSDLPAGVPHKFGAFVLADDDGDVVLMRRKPIKAHPGIENFWWIPGGAQESNETLDQTAIREFHEETGLRCRLDHILLAQSAADRPFVAIFFRGEVTDGALSADDDPTGMSAEARRFPPDRCSL